MCSAPKATAGVISLLMLRAKNVTSVYRLGKEYTAFGPIYQVEAVHCDDILFVISCTPALSFTIPVFCSSFRRSLNSGQPGARQQHFHGHSSVSDLSSRFFLEQHHSSLEEGRAGRR